jgi:hypothetical protein
VTPDQDAFDQWKPSSQKRIENNREEHECKSKKRSVPPMVGVGRDIENEEALKESSSNEGATGDASLPSESTKPSYMTRVRKQALEAEEAGELTGYVAQVTAAASRRQNSNPEILAARGGNPA